MKNNFKILAITVCTFIVGALSAQKASPATSTSTKLNNGTVVTIQYSAPSLKGRTVGKDVEPMQGKIWRAGADDATTFEFSNPVSINGKSIPAGKYSFFVIDNGNDWTLILNKIWKQWGAYDYAQSQDILRFNVKPTKASTSSERLTYSATAEGNISIKWGTVQVDFTVK
jgi:hypothetical protein